MNEKRQASRAHDRQIFALAVPALGALVAEPIFLATDTVMVGHLGADALGGLAIASSLLQTMIGLMIFLAYATTPLVARRWGAGDLNGAISSGVASLVMAAALGIILLGLGFLFGDTLIALMNPTPEVAEAAAQYLFISMLGIPAMLMVLAMTGLLRGLQDTKTPLYISLAGFGLNIVLNYLLIYIFNFGISGSAAGLAIVQWLMFFTFAWVLWRRILRENLTPKLDLAGLIVNLKLGFWLFLRTITLRLGLMAAVAIGTTMGTETLATYQIIFTLYSVTSFALDALAISAQAMVGKALGASDAAGAQAVIRRTIFWGILSGAIIGLIIICLSPFIARIFSDDPAILNMAPWPLIVLGISMPLGGFVFVLDGVLMGAADVRYLAFVGLINLAVYLPVLWVILALQLSGTIGLVALTAAFCIVFMASRAVTLGLRIRGSKWMVLG
ncbi:MAG: MATE family efflux transporter [Microbacteriaceae bacterium]